MVTSVDFSQRVLQLSQQWKARRSKFPSTERQGEQMPLHMMATGAALSNELAFFGCFTREIGQRLGAAIAERAPGVFDSYRPELHYMRGPGPKWREKHGLAPRKKSSRW
jgi:hypothetical protein